MMIKVTELLEANPKPTDDEIKAALTTSGPSAHLCRCASYAAIMDGVHHAARSWRRGAKMTTPDSHFHLWRAAESTFVPGGRRRTGRPLGLKPGEGHAQAAATTRSMRPILAPGSKFTRTTHC